MSISLEWVGIAVAFTQALVALAIGILAWRQNTLANEQQNRQHSIELNVQRIFKIQEWGNECLDVLSNADHFCICETNSPDFPAQKQKLLVQISSLIDRGRLLFGNIEKEKYGTQKSPAYRGFRPKILDPLIAYYVNIEIIEIHRESAIVVRKRLIRWRRYFVSVIQDESGPEWMEITERKTKNHARNIGINIDAYTDAPKEI